MVVPLRKAWIENSLRIPATSFVRSGATADVDEPTLRTHHPTADRTALDSSRNEVTVAGPVDFATLTDAMCGGKRVGERRWEDMLKGPLGESLLRGIEEELNWPTPFPIQQACLPLAKLSCGKGADGLPSGMATPHILAQAENGAGKTGAFCLAAVIQVGGTPCRKPRAIIITTS